MKMDDAKSGKATGEGEVDFEGFKRFMVSRDALLHNTYDQYGDNEVLLLLITFLAFWVSYTSWFMI